MVVFTRGRVLHAVPVHRTVGRKLFRTQLDPVRTQQVPSRTAAVRLAAIVCGAAAIVSSARVHSPSKTRKICDRRIVVNCATHNFKFFKI